MRRRDDQELILKAAELAHVAPKDWAAFIECLKVYSDGASRRCVQAPIEQLQRMQGRAQQCAEITSLFIDAVKTADSIKNNSAVNSAAVQRS